MKNKKAEVKMSGGMVLLIVIIVVAGIWWYSTTTQGGGTTVNTSCPTGTSLVNGVCIGTNPSQTGNTNNPSISTVVTDAITNAAVTSGTTNYVVSPASGGAKFAATNTTYAGISGDSVIALNDPAGNYLAASAGPQVIVNGAQVLSFQVNGYANASVTIKDDPITSSNTVGYVSGTNTYNATHISAGGTRTLPIILQGTTQKSTGKILLTVEGPTSSSSNISSIILSCAGVQVNPLSAIPGCLSAANAASKFVGFEIPAIVGTQTVSCNLVFQDGATYSLTGQVLFKFYAEQKFFDSTNTLTEGICDTSVNGNNALKYQDSYSQQAYLNA